MKAKELVGIVFGSVCLISCSSERDFDISREDITLSIATVTGKEQRMSRFSEILSKASYERKEVRDFLKAQALEKIDNGYNIFYPVAKGKELETGVTLRDVLVEYSSDAEIEAIEQTVPLLNIHVPELAGTKVVDMDTGNEEIPVMYSRRIYLDGTLVDSLGSDEVPGFHLYVVDESGSIRQKQGGAGLRQASADLEVNGEYEYVDPVFSPAHTKKSSLRASGLEELSEKYTGRGWVPQSEIDPELLTACRNSGDNLRATRCMMYYGMSTPSQEPGSLRTDVKDAIFRFRISRDAFSAIESIATGGGRRPFFQGNTSNKKTALSREEVLNRLLTGRAFCFVFRIEGDIQGETVVSKGMTVYAGPEELFNLYITENRRHPTWFRHTKYTYSISTTRLEEKWFYPMEHGRDTRLDEWNIAYQPITKRIVMYIVDTNSDDKLVEEDYAATYITMNESGIDIRGNIQEIIKTGIEGKQNPYTTTTYIKKTRYEIESRNQKLSEFYFNFFDDYPIEQIQGNEYVVPAKIGNGAIEMTILPISNSFFYK